MFEPLLEQNRWALRLTCQMSSWRLERVVAGAARERRVLDQRLLEEREAGVSRIVLNAPSR